MTDITFDLWLEFEHWAPHREDDPTDSFFNMAITLSTGQTRNH
ncbi:MAG: hypothetical protein KatS3mg057_2243 [Herpetosiphonaceae bacterium]|nr:MAG: hypothetical protein KatS3mg057_2243 [Herpetosiphonaceae bacterium]